MAVAGPLAGLVLALPLYAFGLHSSIRLLPPASEGGGEFVLGFAILPALLAQLVFGALPPGHVIDLHPIAVAGWFGFFVTALNLIPAGQLDGGHLVYALFGRRTLLISARRGGLMLIGLAFGSPTWLIWGGPDRRPHGVPPRADHGRHHAAGRPRRVLRGLRPGPDLRAGRRCRSGSTEGPPAGGGPRGCATMSGRRAVAVFRERAS
jgi:membrane-associated protease RseP (regulator of RpoE activity)